MTRREEWVMLAAALVARGGCSIDEAAYRADVMQSEADRRFGPSEMRWPAQEAKKEAEHG